MRGCYGYEVLGNLFTRQLDALVTLKALNRLWIKRTNKEQPPHPPFLRFTVVTLSTLLTLSAQTPSSALPAVRLNLSTNLLQVQSVLVGGQPRQWRPGRVLRLGSSPESVTFGFGPTGASRWLPTRLRYKLEGYDVSWQEGHASMCLTVRFTDDHGDQVGQSTFEAVGESAVWNGSFTNSALSHRRETLVAPPAASSVWVTISSGCGPPATVGIYLVQDLVMSRITSSNGPPQILLRPSFSPDVDNSPPRDWVRDGIRPSMAKIVDCGEDPKVQAFAIVDDDPVSHAEWHNLRQTAPRIAPGDKLVLEWNELFSIGVGDTRSAFYSRLPAGNFRFRVQELTALGVPTGVEDSLGVHVAMPLWTTPLFWPAVLVAFAAVAVGASRYAAWYRMRREVAHLRQQRALERERLRIAQDIHDDLGARVTQIALLSGIAQDDPALPERARAEFNQVSRLTRDLISALYETVWAVDPENDNLDALGNYLCQVLNDLCNQARLRCRLELTDLPTNIQVSSQTRHNIIMAVKETVHNSIKHAQAAEVILAVAYKGSVLTISVQDDGCGFTPAAQNAGNGLHNMKQRLASIGGACRIVSEPGGPTRVEMTVAIPNLQANE